MSQLIKKIWKSPSFLKMLLSFDSQQNAFFKYFKVMPRHKDMTENIVLIQCVESLFYFGLFGQIVSSLREQKSIRVEQFVLRSLNVGESDSICACIKARFLNIPHSLKWTRLYGSFCDGIGYRSTSFNPIGDLIDLYAAWKRWIGLSDKKMLINLKILDIAVGDLVNDSFLRFKPAPTVDMKDIYLLILIWQAHRDVRRSMKYFKHIKPDLYLTSYCTYIQHGIAVRVALACGVQVFSFGDYQDLTKKLTLNDWFNLKNTDLYATAFAKLDNQQKKLALAENALSARMAGVTDRATSYMKKSAYALSGDQVPDVKGAVVIFLHDFYDSPHIYPKVVFPDFWDWICFTVETLIQAKIPFFVKPHPNQISLSEAVLDDLKRRYASLPIVPAGITNKQLVEAGMVCAITVYGTVAHEMAYLGVPTITSAQHPHISFDFCKTAKTKHEYAEMLCNFRDIKFDKINMHEQSLIFYYMHNLNLEEEEKRLRDLAWEFRMECAKSEANNIELINYVKKISSSSSFKSLILMWSNLLSVNCKSETEHAN